jgi:hypothetical protein
MSAAKSRIGPSAGRPVLVFSACHPCAGHFAIVASTTGAPMRDVADVQASCRDARVAQSRAASRRATPHSASLHAGYGYLSKATPSVSPTTEKKLQKLIPGLRSGVTIRNLAAWLFRAFMRRGGAGQGRRPDIAAGAADTGQARHRRSQACAEAPCLSAVERREAPGPTSLGSRAPKRCVLATGRGRGRAADLRHWSA